MNRIDSFLELAVQQGGSDLHLVSGQTPKIRINGILQPVRFRELSVEDVERMLLEFMTEPQRHQLEERLAFDFAYRCDTAGRFRVNAYRHTKGLAAVFRSIPDAVRTMDDIGLPACIKGIINRPKGLTLVTGPTGSGKSTTLAAMVDHVNATRKGHIITLEDPIEFIHPNKQCVLTQREIGSHTVSFQEGLRNALREDPDLILVGEMRDPETIALALTASETGVQVFGTIHTNGTARSIDRIVNAFPARRQDQIRTMLADGLAMVISQQLVRLADGSGRTAVHEILVNSHAAASVIRSGQSHKLTSVIQAGARIGMQSLDARLLDLLRKGTITGEEAYEHAVERAQFERYVSFDQAA